MKLKRYLPSLLTFDVEETEVRERNCVRKSLRNVFLFVILLKKVLLDLKRLERCLPGTPRSHSIVRVDMRDGEVGVGPAWVAGGYSGRR